MNNLSSVKDRGKLIELYAKNIAEAPSEIKGDIPKEICVAAAIHRVELFEKILGGEFLYNGLTPSSAAPSAGCGSNRCWKNVETVVKK